jgi:hypothetical protein
MFKKWIFAAAASMLFSSPIFAVSENKTPPDNKGHECCTNSDKEWSLGVSLQKNNIINLEKTIDSQDVFSAGAVASYYFKNNDNYKGCFYYSNAQFKGAFVRQYALRIKYMDLANLPLLSILEQTMGIYINNKNLATERSNFEKDCLQGINDFYLHVKKWNVDDYNMHLKNSLLRFKVKIDQQAMNEEIKNFIENNLPYEIQKVLIERLKELKSI